MKKQTQMIMLLFAFLATIAKSQNPSCSNALVINSTAANYTVANYQDNEYWVRMDANTGGQSLTIKYSPTYQFTKMHVYTGSSCGSLTLVDSTSTVSDSAHLYLTGSSNQYYWIKLSQPVMPLSGITFDVVMVPRNSWINIYDSNGWYDMTCAQSFGQNIQCVFYVCPGQELNFQVTITPNYGNFGCYNAFCQWNYSMLIPITPDTLTVNTALMPSTTFQDSLYPQITQFQVPVNAIVGSTDTIWFDYSFSGCSDTALHSSEYIVVQVISAPVVAMSVTPNPTCSGVTVTTNPISTPQVQDFHYYYNYGDDTLLHTQSTYGYPYASPGSYVVTEYYYEGMCMVELHDTVQVVEEGWMVNFQKDCNLGVMATILNPCLTIGQNSIIYYDITWGDGTGLTSSLTNSGGPDTLNHTYSSAGTYTITILQSGIVDTTFTIQIPPVVPQPSITSASLTECSGTNANYSVQNPYPNITYSWEVQAYNGTTTYVAATGTGNSFIVNWPSILQANTSYTICLTATNANGCTKVACIPIADCCSNDQIDELVFDNCTIVPYGTGSVNFVNDAQIWNTYAGAPIVNQTIGIQSNAINGYKITVLNKLTFDNGANTFTITGSNMILNPYARMVVKSPLSMSDNYLHGCGMMWDQIELQSTITVNRCVIEDASIAIVKKATGIYQIQNSIFNKNHTDLYIVSNTNANMLTNSFIKNTAFTSRTLPNAYYPTIGGTLVGFQTNNVNWSVQPSANMKGNFTIPNNIPSVRAMYISNNVTATTGMIIGDNSLTNGGANALTNLYDNHESGIIISRTKVTLVNNRFLNVPYSSNTNTSAAAVVVNGSQPGFNIVPANVTVGGISLNERNIFSTCKKGVLGNVSSTLLVKKNSFSSVVEAVVLQNWQYGTPTLYTAQILENTLTNCTTGVNCYMNTNINCTISANTMNNNAGSANATGIILNEFSSATTGAKYSITSNNPIQGMYHGIKCYNINMAKIEANKIITRPTTYPTYAAAIYQANCLNNVIKDNNLQNSPSSANYGHWLYGILSDVSPGSQISCNKIKEIGVCMKFQGAQASDVFNNYLNYDTPTMPNACLFGIWLENQGFIDTQDWPGSNSTQPSDNRFGAFLTTAPYGDTYSANGSNGDTIFWRDNGNNTIWEPQVNNVSNAVSQVNAMPINTNLQSEVSCSAIPTGKMSAVNSDMKIFNNAELIALDQITFSSNDESTRSMNKRGLYLHIKGNSIDVSDNNVLSSFLQQCDDNNYGKFRSVDTLLAFGVLTNDSLAIDAAKSLNYAITSATNSEFYQKQVNSIYGNFLINHFNSPNEIAVLQYIAGLCPFTEGTGVYQARALLRAVDTIEYYSNCEIPQNIQSGSRLSSGSNSTKDRIALVYPSPAKEQLNLIIINEECENATFEIYDLFGNLVHTSAISSCINTLDLRSFGAGTYIYKLISNGKLIQNDKFVIIK